MMHASKEVIAVVNFILTLASPHISPGHSIALAAALYNVMSMTCHDSNWDKAVRLRDSKLGSEIRYICTRDNHSSAILAGAFVLAGLSQYETRVSEIGLFPEMAISFNPGLVVAVVKIENMPSSHLAKMPAYFGSQLLADMMRGETHAALSLYVEESSKSDIDVSLN